jgi:broad specificity phosphatase PhoE
LGERPLRVIEHFRHSMRHAGGVHLTQAGVDLARKLGAGLGRFDTVITSDVPRAVETAIAMGYAVDGQMTTLATLLFADERAADWRDGCAGFARAAKHDEVVARSASVHAYVMRTIAASLADGGRALVVSHGGIIELGVVGLLPERDYSDWGPACSYCEGVRLSFQGDRCIGAEPLRLPPGLAT